MIHIYDLLSAESSAAILCCYINVTERIQIVRVPQLTNGFCDRVIFPGERLMFEAKPEDLLEIHSAKPANIILSQKIPCARLQVCEVIPLKRETENREMLAEKPA
ncbi:DUF1830 domain-containing protein [Kamptonema formosum]|uniref:DUF1830 domain-containing protein n=1 Tax=Kamptonema formosum TaxID=331992 RepID=UPI00036D1D5E|nr:DUF1830 domain-containing protein [Oscillatoria sp. PCC 10802]